MSKDNKDQPDKMTAGTATASGHPGRARKTDRTVQTAIGTRLRAYYDEVAREAVPDRFVELLKRLEDKGTGGDKA